MHCQTNISNISSSINWVVLELALSGRFHLLRGDNFSKERKEREIEANIFLLLLCVLKRSLGVLLPTSKES